MTTASRTAPANGLFVDARNFSVVEATSGSGSEGSPTKYSRTRSSDVTAAVSSGPTAPGACNALRTASAVRPSTRSVATSPRVLSSVRVTPGRAAWSAATASAVSASAEPVSESVETRVGLPESSATHSACTPGIGPRAGQPPSGGSCRTYQPSSWASPAVVVVMVPTFTTFALDLSQG